jgi:Tripartite tricarboxylate transporter TctB family.
MLSRDYRDIVGGGLLLLFGIWAAWYSASEYDLGSFRRMGPGMFPFLLGIVLSVLGLLMALPAFFRPGAKVQVRLLVPAVIILSVLSFAVLIGPFGLIPAVVGVTVISALGEERFRPLAILMLCAVLSLIAWLIFRVGLGLTLSMVDWPSETRTTTPATPRTNAMDISRTSPWVSASRYRAPTCCIAFWGSWSEPSSA